MLFTKKHIKKAACIATAAVCAAIYATSTIPASAANDPYLSELGFNVDSYQYPGYGMCEDLINKFYYQGGCIGIVSTNMYFTSYKNKLPNKKRLNVAMYCNYVYPKYAYIYGDLPVQGLIQDLVVETTLPRQDQRFVRSAPITQAYNSSYNLSATFGYDDGFVATATISGLCQYPKDKLKVYNESKRENNKYRINYEYQVQGGVNLMSKNAYLVNESEQTGTFYYQTPGTCFNFPVRIQTTWGYINRAWPVDLLYKNKLTDYQDWLIAIN